MNHHLSPDWNFEGDVPVPNQKKPMGQDHELVELLWRNGQVVLHSQTQRKQGLPSNESRQVQKHDQLTMLRNGGSYGNWSNLVQDEDTISWIQYPLEDSLDKEFCSNLFMEFPPNIDPIQPGKPVRNSEEEGKSVSNVVPTPQQPPYKQLGTHEFTGNPMPPPKFPVQQNPNPGKIINFSNFSLPGRDNLGSCRPQLGGKGKGTGGDGKECSVMTAGLMSHCGSNQLLNEAALSLFSSRDNVLRMVSQEDGKQTETLEPTVTSSSGGGSGSSFDRTYKQSTDGKSHKRKMRETEESECQSEAAEDESAARNKKSQRSGSGSTRRSRAAEVHNLSERRRRDRINEKMRALQELIPHSNKSDKASMLDEAIEYLKSLQLQLQLMWMGTGVAPMLFPGVQHYMPRMGMGMGMGMGMCPPSLPSIHNQMHLQRVQLLDQSTMPAAPPPNQPQICQTPVLNPVNYQNQMQNPNFSEQFAHYMGFHPMQTPSQPMNVFSFGSQSQATTSPSITGGPHAGADGAPSSKLG